ncbi:serine protease [Streptomyces sp. NPDC046887]|uniref:serine protease n=1 Tax=Streptomyces sp. NPDC046887 TaxID=3155472 RepID=UPI0033FB6965
MERADRRTEPVRNPDRLDDRLDGRVPDEPPAPAAGVGDNGRPAGESCPLDDGGPEPVWIRDPAGRLRGAGFAADDHGTVVTSHQTVDGLTRATVQGPDGTAYTADADAVVPLPAAGLALIRTEGLGLSPLPIATRTGVPAGTYLRFHADGPRQARVLGPASVTYTATEHFHRIDGVLELAMGTDAGEALRTTHCAGAPVLDPATGAVLAVLGGALHTGHRAAGFAVPLAHAAATDPHGPLAALLARNAATVPAYGEDLNLAGALQLTATTGADAPDTGLPPVERRHLTRELDAFLALSSTAAVCALVGDPGTGRSTELAALTARRARGPEPAPTLRLRGADLADGDASLADALARALRQAGRIAACSGASGDMATATPERVARLARESGRPLLVLLDGPEEMPPGLAHRLPDWTVATAHWLHAHGARLITACRPEHWERAGALYPSGALHRPGRPAPRLPDAVHLGDLSAREAGRARQRYGLPADALTEADGRHPLTLRLLAEVRAALPAGGGGGRQGCGEGAADGSGGRPGRKGTSVAGSIGRPGREEGAIAGGEGWPGRAEGAASRAEGAAGGGDGRLRRPEVFAAGNDGWARHEEGSAARNDGLPGWAEGPVAGGDDRPERAEGAAGGSRAEGAAGGGDGRPGWAEGVVAGSMGRPRREEVFAAHLDLSCLRVAVRVAAASRPAPRGAEVRRLAARVAGRVHEAARRCLGPGQGGLDRASFEELFPWSTGWASAVLTEGLLVPAGPGYRFAHEEVADWLQGAHLDLDAALDALVMRGGAEGEGPGVAPVPRDRVGPVVQAMLLLGRVHGPAALDHRLQRLVHALDRLPADSARPRVPDARWWAGRLLGGTLERTPDLRPHLGTLRLLADRLAAAGSAPVAFGPWFWEGLPLSGDERADLLRRLLPADVPSEGSGEAVTGFPATAARWLAADPRGVQPLLCRWFGDERALPAAPGARERPTVGDAAQALLHAHRALAPDDLCEALVATAHPRAGDLLAALAEDEPTVLCRAVDRWAHDGARPERRSAAARYAPLAAAHATTPADRRLLHYAALALLDRPGDTESHGPALALLVADPETRADQLPRALAAFQDGDPALPPQALAPALTSHPEPVLAAFHERLAADRDAGAVMEVLAAAEAPSLVRRAAALVAAYTARHPGGARNTAAYLDRCLERGPVTHAVLSPLVGGLLREGPAEVRAALARVLATPGSPASLVARTELLDELLAVEERRGPDPVVLDALLETAAAGAGLRTESRTRDLVRRTGQLWTRTPEGGDRLRARLAGLAAERPAFAALTARWAAADPATWLPLLGSDTSHPCYQRSDLTPMLAEPHRHGSLSPA